jgi:hypothetical protein
MSIPLFLYVLCVLCESSRSLGRHVTPVAHGGNPQDHAGSFMPGNPSRAVALLPVTIADWRTRRVVRFLYSVHLHGELVLGKIKFIRGGLLTGNS